MAFGMSHTSTCLSIQTQFFLSQVGPHLNISNQDCHGMWHIDLWKYKLIPHSLQIISAVVNDDTVTLMLYYLHLNIFLKEWSTNSSN